MSFIKKIFCKDLASGCFFSLDLSFHSSTTFPLQPHLGELLKYKHCLSSPTPFIHPPFYTLNMKSKHFVDHINCNSLPWMLLIQEFHSCYCSLSNSSACLVYQPYQIFHMYFFYWCYKLDEFIQWKEGNHAWYRTVLQAQSTRWNRTQELNPGGFQGNNILDFSHQKEIVTTVMMISPLSMLLNMVWRQDIRLVKFST